MLTTMGYHSSTMAYYSISEVDRCLPKFTATRTGILMLMIYNLKGYFHSTKLIQSFLNGFFKFRQNKALGGRGFKFGLGFLGFVLRLAAAADMVAATLVAARAVFHAQLRGCCSAPGGPSPPSTPSRPLSQVSPARGRTLVDRAVRGPTVCGVDETRAESLTRRHCEGTPANSDSATPKCWRLRCADDPVTRCGKSKDGFEYRCNDVTDPSVPGALSYCLLVSGGRPPLGMSLYDDDTT